METEVVGVMSRLSMGLNANSSEVAHIGESSILYNQSSHTRVFAHLSIAFFLPIEK